MKKIILTLCALFPLVVVVGCGSSSESSVVTPDDTFYETLEATSLTDDESPRTGAK